MRKERSPGFKLFMAAAIGLALIIPLSIVYLLVSDRQHQSRVAQDNITQGWGGAQVVTGPVLVVPYDQERQISEQQGDRTVTRTVTERRELYLSAEQQTINAGLEPETRSYSIYQTVTYLASLDGTSRFALPADFERLGVDREDLLFDEAELRFGASDARGLQSGAEVTANGTPVELKPGRGPNASGNSGFHGFFDWSESEPLELTWSYSVRGSRSIAIVPRGGESTIIVTSPWPHPSFGGDFIPDTKEVAEEGFTASWSVTNLALNEALVRLEDPGPPTIREAEDARFYSSADTNSGQSRAASIRLIEPVDVYNQVDRSVKYGFLFIGFTFLAFLMFDLIAGARVAAAEYLLTGVGLVLFFVLLLAFSEVIGFALAYVVASAAVIGLLTAYSAAVLSSWKRSGVIGALLVGLYALLYILLSLEAYSLIIGSLLLFVALAAVMYATRSIDWSSVAVREDKPKGEGEQTPQVTAS
ncbi:cell envelope integrity protein CreD [Qipengyuania sp. DGS5-3]|uniref:cell envelope integrity protein CreD n=1 Tax=Qipengyuania sp. DGS5-3 TaxID=3349632 RepID=UPI0036D22915